MPESHPTSPLPDFLAGLQFPATPDDAVEHARRHGASAAMLDVLESLPAAVFTSADGLRHALFGVTEASVQGLHPPPTFPSHDGTTS